MNICVCICKHIIYVNVYKLYTYTNAKTFCAHIGVCISVYIHNINICDSVFI